MRYIKVKFSAIILFGIGLNVLQAQIAKDIDGNTYKTVTIGNQTWMAENLKVTKLNDGTAIALVADPSAWQLLKTPGYSWYKNDAATYKDTYGALYNWYCVGTGKLCPTGFHVPSDAEWTTLMTFLGGLQVAGGKLKEKGITHWWTPNTSATNETGFTALPGGKRYPYPAEIGEYANFWSSTTGFDREFARTAWAYRLYYNSPAVLRAHEYFYKFYGFSIRCVKD